MTNCHRYQRRPGRLAGWSGGLLCALLGAALLAPAGALARDLQVILVRHAEKAADDGNDPALSSAGEARAAALATALRASGIDAVYATQFQRTQRTAAPAAAHAGVPVTVRSASGDAADAARFAAQLREQHAGQTVLVVGHSNTIAPLADALLGHSGAVPPLTEDEYDRLLVIGIDDAGASPPRLLSVRYGAAGH